MNKKNVTIEEVRMARECASTGGVLIGWLTGWYAKNIDQLIERLGQAVNDLMSDPRQVSRTANAQHLLR
ncbi:MAG: hypothetical protein D6780_02350 [Candidatus Dadabacteria bacterium]|nr:MAG: hypothetical protein D6780_02350 [Candidatus Dadabacteria bacterium]